MTNQPDRQEARSRTLICVTGLRGVPNVMGGVEAHCQELFPRLAALAPDLDIEILGRRPYMGDRSQVFEGVRVTPLASPKQQSLEAIASTMIGLLHAKRRGAQCVHIHAVGPALVAPLARLLGMRVVMTHHGADYDRAKWSGFAKWMLRLGERLGIRSADAVIAVAPSLTAKLKADYPPYARKIGFIPNGPSTFPQAEFDPTLFEGLGVEPNRYILAVGRLVPEKGFDLLINAFRDSGDNRKLLIAGAADHESKFSRALLEEAGDKVIFAGSQPRAALEHLYRHADLFVLPSSHEGLPISALEAGSLGSPILLSDIQPNRDLGLAKQNYFPSGDRRALASALAQPGSDFRIDAAAFATFDWAQIAEQTLAVYREVLSQPGGSAPGKAKRTLVSGAQSEPQQSVHKR